MDGINGITGGYSLIILIALAYINRIYVPFVVTGPIYTMLLRSISLNFLISANERDVLPVMSVRSV